MNRNIVHNLIMDIGMHVGQDTEFYLKKGFKVVACEPNKRLVESTTEKLSEYVERDDLTILNVGICGNTGKRKFYANSTNDVWSSFDSSLGSRGGDYQEYDVECLTLQDLLNEYGSPHYLKIDAEGYEPEVIKTLFNSRDRSDYISVANPNSAILHVLYEAGYNYFKLSNQAEVSEEGFQSTTRCGRSVEHTFLPGSSGRFGTELEGEWLTKEVIKRKLDSYWQLSPQDRLSEGWFDIHASIIC